MHWEYTQIGLFSQSYSWVFLEDEINHVAPYITGWDQFWLEAAPDTHLKHLGFLFLQRFVLTQVHILSCRKILRPHPASPAYKITAHIHRLTHTLSPITTDSEGLPLSVCLLFISQRAIPLHSPSQPTPQRNADVGKTPYMHIHMLSGARTTQPPPYTHTYFSCLTQTHTQLVSQLTHSLLFWVVLELYCQGDDRGNFP